MGTKKVKTESITGYVGWAYIKGKDRGVIALKNIKAGTIVERCPMVPLPAEDTIPKHGRKTILDSYLMAWGKEDANGDTKNYAIGGGLMIIYNHSKNPNIRLLHNYKKRTIEIKTLRNIKAGEELTYNYAYPEDSNLWFKIRE